MNWQPLPPDLHLVPLNRQYLLWREGMVSAQLGHLEDRRALPGDGPDYVWFTEDGGDYAYDWFEMVCQVELPAEANRL